MKAIYHLLIIACIGVIIITFGACKKNNTPPTNGNNTVKGDTLLSFNTKISDIDTLQTIYKDGPGNRKYFLYGTRNSAGEFTGLSSIASTRGNSTDTIANYLFGPDQKVKALYFTIKGKKESSYITFDYYTDSVVVNLNKMDWETGSFYLVNRSKQKPSNTSSNLIINTAVQKQGSPQTNTDADIALSANGLSAIIAINAIIVAVPTIIGYVVFNSATGGVAGFALGVYFVYNKLAHSSESDAVPKNLPKNPSQEKFAIIASRQIIALSGSNAQYIITSIPIVSIVNYMFQFEGQWSHYLLGTQNSVGGIIKAGPVIGNIKILLSVQSLTNGAILQQSYYNGTPIKVSQKNVKVVCIPIDINSPRRHADGGIPAADIKQINMSVVYYTLK